jgi:3-polyprenyl-4-hydroxybenzoate decarboxylase
MKALLVLAIVLVSTATFGKESLETLRTQCMYDLVTSNNTESCVQYEQEQKVADTKTKAEQCAIDKVRVIDDLEIQGCMERSKLAKVVTEINGSFTYKKLSASGCKEYLRNEFCK